MMHILPLHEILNLPFIIEMKNSKFLKSSIINDICHRNTMRCEHQRKMFFREISFKCNLNKNFVLSNQVQRETNKSVHYYLQGEQLYY